MTPEKIRHYGDKLYAAWLARMSFVAGPWNA
jgi:hypothetical protein